MRTGRRSQAAAARHAAQAPAAIQLGSKSIRSIPTARKNSAAAGMPATGLRPGCGAPPRRPRLITTNRSGCQRVIASGANATTIASAVNGALGNMPDATTARAPTLASP